MFPYCLHTICDGALMLQNDSHCHYEKIEADSPVILRMSGVAVYDPHDGSKNVRSSGWKLEMEILRMKEE